MKPFPLVLGLALAMSKVLGADLQFVTNADDAPFSIMKDGALSGAATEEIRDALRQLRMTADFAVYPWTRALTITESSGNACIFPAARTPEREKLFKWVGPLGEDSWAVFARPDSDIRLAAIGDLNRYRVGANRNEAMATFLEQNNVRVDWVTDKEPNRTNIQKLFSGRIDLWASRSAHVVYLSRALGFEPPRQALVLKRLGFYLACNRGVDDAVIARLNGVIGQMQQDGRYDALLRRYQ